MSVAFPKPRKPFKSAAYLAWVRTQPCCITGQWPVEASHIDRPGEKALGSKCSDYRVLPMTSEVHRTGAKAYHRLGYRAFEEAWGVDLESLIVDHLLRWMEGNA